MTNINNYSLSKYNQSMPKLLTREEFDNLLPEDINDEKWQISSITNNAINTKKDSTDLYSSREVHEQRTGLLNSTAINKVSVYIGFRSDTEAANKIINNNITRGIKDVFSDFGVKEQLNTQIKKYQADEPLAQINSLIRQGITEFQKSDPDTKELDKFLYQLSLAIDDTATQSEQELLNNPDFDQSIHTNKAIGIDDNAERWTKAGGIITSATLQVWQAKDVNKKQIIQEFNITNKEGDIVSLRASFHQSQSLSTNEYKETTKALNVTMTKGSLSEEEQQEFNRFLDDFANVTNNILVGDLASANQAFTTLKAEDYGFQAIEKTLDWSEEQIQADKILLHTFNKRVGHLVSDSQNRTQSDSSIINDSYIKGGQFHNKRRISTANLADFDIKYANNISQASSGISKNLRYDKSQDSLYGLSHEYGKSRDGLVLSNEQGELYQYQYNEQNRTTSGWTKVNSEGVNYLALKESPTFNNFRLNTQDSEQITLTHLPTNTVKDYDTSLLPEAIDKQYSNSYDQQVFEDKNGNLYQYQFNGNYQNSGWLQIENNPENRQLLQSRQDKEGYMHKYLTVNDQESNSVQFANLVNFRESKHTSDININMQILN